jgi:hypothetical protein
MAFDLRISDKISIEGHREKKKNRRKDKKLGGLKNGVKEGRKSKSEQERRTDAKTLWLGTLCMRSSAGYEITRNILCTTL